MVFEWMHPATAWTSTNVPKATLAANTARTWPEAFNARVQKATSSRPMAKHATTSTNARLTPSSTMTKSVQRHDRFAHTNVSTQSARSCAIVQGTSIYNQICVRVNEIFVII